MILLEVEVLIQTILLLNWLNNVEWCEVMVVHRQLRKHLKTVTVVFLIQTTVFDIPVSCIV